MSSAFEGLPKTPNLKLNKPGYDNVADIEALNENADILDAEIQGIKNTFVKSVNGINAGDDGNVDLGIIPISQGGTGATTASDACKNLGAVQTVNGKEPDAGGNVNVEEYTHPNSGVTAGTYRSVTVNAQGHVTGGSNPTLAIANGGTGQTTAANALKAFVGSSALGSSSKPIYYTGSAFAACSASVGAANNGGIIASSKGTNGYVKFADGTIIQWGVTVSGTGTFPIAFNTVYACVTIMYSPDDTGTESFYGYIYSLSTTQVKIKRRKWESYFIAIGN